jgi:methionyl-tRNA formyltransferase
LVEKTEATIAMVIYSSGQKPKDRTYYLRRIRKIMKIGVLGALNGIRIRKWFSGGELKSSLEDIEKICHHHQIRFEQTPYISHPRTTDLMKQADADLGLSLGNSYIPSKVFTVPALGMINIHGEVLPAFQNAQSVVWQIYENSGLTGYTIHQIDKKIDTGRIIKQEVYPILFRHNLEQTVRDTVDETLRRAGHGLVDVVNQLQAYLANARPQGIGKIYTTPGFFQFIRICRNFNRLKSQSEIQAGASPELQ